jgi:hypothetical protein
MSGTTWPNTVLISDVFRSEKAVAMVLRRHVHRPGKIVSNNAAGRWLRSAIRRIDPKALDWKKPPANWPRTSERVLIDALLAHAATEKGSESVLSGLRTIDRSRGLAPDNPLGEGGTGATAFQLDRTGLE